MDTKIATFDCGGDELSSAFELSHHEYTGAYTGASVLRVTDTGVLGA